MPNPIDRGFTGLAPMLKLDALKVRSLWVLLLILLGLGVTLAAASGFSASLPLFVMTALAASTSMVSQDENYRLSRLYGTLPVSRRAVITSHYLLGLGLQLATLGCALATVTGVGLWQRSDPYLGVLAAVGAFSLAILIFAIQVPLQLRFGSQRGSLLLLGVLFATGLAIKLALDALRPSPASFESIVSWVSGRSWALLGIAVSIQLVCLAASWLIAVRIYERQDH